MEANSTNYLEGNPAINLTLLVRLLGIFAFVGNIFVVSVIIKCPSLHTSSNYLTASLAIVDLSSSLPMMLLMENTWLLYFVFFYLTSVSLTHLLAMTIDKYLLITRPFFYQRISKKCVCILICIVWITPLITFADGRITFKSTDVIIFVCENLYQVTLISIISLTVGLISYFIIISLNVRIYIIACKQFRQINAVISGQPLATFAASWKATKTTMIVIGAFMICSTPTYIFVLLSLFCCDLPHIVNNLIVPSLSINSVLNPIIYTFRRQEFKNAARNVIKALRISG
ncbi:dopamine receptor 2-like [Anneissia japonica]|uniref:dopamine receptor 2-like n=1 Tax=Anneissia japonica TaxID=1529436 RepID=UPI0014255EC6|nr:dopamine receptor 2-like [Anneissia japonica]